MNRKHVAALCLLFLISSSVYSQSIKILDLSLEGERIAYITKDYIYMVFEYDKKYAVLNKNALAVNSEGYLILSYNNKKCLIIDGDAFFQYFDNFAYASEKKYDIVDESQVRYHDYDLLSITASSYLSETVDKSIVKYSPENLFKAFFIDCSCHPYFWDDRHIPWVEGVAGNGIGESVSITFKEPVKYFSILNGYVDRNNTKLFYQNARAKEVRIYYTNQKYIDVSLPDLVYFKLVALPQATKNIKIEILDVYQGSKYQDTCISALVIHRKINSSQERDVETEKYIDDVLLNYKKINSSEPTNRLNLIMF